MIGDNADLWQDLLSLLIGVALTTGIEALRRIQQRTSPPTGRHSADNQGGPQ